MPKKSSLKKVATTVYLEPDQADALRKLADASRISQANYIREAIDDILEKYEWKKTRATSGPPRNIHSLVPKKKAK